MSLNVLRKYAMKAKNVGKQQCRLHLA